MKKWIIQTKIRLLTKADFVWLPPANCAKHILRGRIEPTTPRQQNGRVASLFAQDFLRFSNVENVACRPFHPLDHVKKRRETKRPEAFASRRFVWLPLLDLNQRLPWLQICRSSLAPNWQVCLAVRMTAFCKQKRQTLPSVARKLACPLIYEAVGSCQKRRETKRPEAIASRRFVWLPLLDLNQRLPD